jgi:uncharacterized coiled-coil protein SlyX
MQKQIDSLEAYDPTKLTEQYEICIEENPLLKAELRVQYVKHQNLVHLMQVQIDSLTVADESYPARNTRERKLYVERNGLLRAELETATIDKIVASERANGFAKQLEISEKFLAYERSRSEARYVELLSQKNHYNKAISDLRAQLEASTLSVAYAKKHAAYLVKNLEAYTEHVTALDNKLSTLKETWY